MYIITMYLDLYDVYISIEFQVFDGDEGRWKTTTLMQAFLVPGQIQYDNDM